MGSWLSRARIMLRDEGEAAFEGERYKKDEKDASGGVVHRKGDLVLDPLTYQPVDPPREARNRWPDKTGVYVRPRLSGGDLAMINRLGRRADALMAELKEEHIDDLHNDLEAQIPAVIQLSVVVTGFECRIATLKECGDNEEEFKECNVFEDPKTRPDYVSDLEEGTAGTGKMLTMPDDAVKRVKTIARLPAEIIGIIASLYSDKQGNPLPGTRAV